MPPELAHVRSWIFDLDNTLYPASADLFGLIDARMTRFVADLLKVDAVEARRIQKDHFHRHGTTLSGLMADHGIEPRAFLDFVHDIEMDALTEDRRLVEAVAKLPGRKLVFTNGDAAYAGRVLAKLGLGASFEAIHDIHACAYRPKPHADSYSSMCGGLGVDPATALFVEDMARNLVPAKAMGMTTVWVDNGSEQAGADVPPGTIDYRITDVGAWLHGLVTEDA